jgi:glycosyltransferase involved in cell wall biosynthesis
MKVVHLIQRFPPAIGGCETWCEGVTHQLVSRGHSVEVLTLRVLDERELWAWNGSPQLPQEVALGRADLLPSIRIRRCAPSPSPYGLMRLAERFGVRIVGRYSAELFGRALALARETDVLHVHQCNVPLSFWGFLAARLGRCPVVITPHFHPGSPNFEQPAVWCLLRRCDAVIAVSPYEARLFERRGVPARRVVIASNALDPRPFDQLAIELIRRQVRALWGLEPEAAIITFVGRKAPQKDIPVLAEAATRVSRTRDVTLVLAGPQSQSYQGDDWQKRESTGLRLIDLPIIPEASKRAIIAASDVVVQPSPHEAFGIVFLEAWASHVPVVGAAAGAIPHVVADGGLTFTPGDAEDLATKLIWLLEHPCEAHAMAARGRARLESEYTWERVGAAVEQAYAVALGRERFRDA